MPRVGKPDLKERLLETALRCFARKGYHETTLDDIASEAQVTKGAVYWHYKDKADLFLCVLRDRVDILADQVYVEIQHTPDPCQQLRVFLETALNFYADNPEFASLVGLMRVGRYSGLEPYLTEELRTFYRRARMLIGEVIAEGTAQGVFLEQPPEMMAAGLLAVIDGIVLQWVIDPEAIDLRGLIPLIIERTLLSISAQPSST